MKAEAARVGTRIGVATRPNRLLPLVICCGGRQVHLPLHSALFDPREGSARQTGRLLQSGSRRSPYSSKLRCGLNAPAIGTSTRLEAVRADCTGAASVEQKKWT